MREIRSSGLEGGVEFKPPSLPLFYSTHNRSFILCVFQRRGEDDWRNFARPTRRAAEKQRIIRRCVTINRPLLRSHTCVFDCVFVIVLALAGLAETVLRQSRDVPRLYLRLAANTVLGGWKMRPLRPRRGALRWPSWLDGPPGVLRPGCRKYILYK